MRLQNESIPAEIEQLDRNTHADGCPRLARESGKRSIIPRRTQKDLPPVRTAGVE